MPHTQGVKKVWFNENSGGSYNTMQNFFGGCSLNATKFTSANNRVVNVQLPCSGTSSGMDWSVSPANPAACFHQILHEKTRRLASNPSLLF
jgi:Gametolysin peptidase M11